MDFYRNLTNSFAQLFWIGLLIASIWAGITKRKFKGLAIVTSGIAVMILSSSLVGHFRDSALSLIFIFAVFIGGPALLLWGIYEVFAEKPWKKTRK